MDRIKHPSSHILDPVVNHQPLPLLLPLYHPTPSTCHSPTPPSSSPRSADTSPPSTTSRSGSDPQTNPATPPTPPSTYLVAAASTSSSPPRCCPPRRPANVQPLPPRCPRVPTRSARPTTRALVPA